MAEQDLWLAIEGLQSQQREMASEIKYLREQVSSSPATVSYNSPESRARSLVQSAEYAFYTHEEAIAWLQKANPGLDDLTPLDAARRSLELTRRSQEQLVEIALTGCPQRPLVEKLKDLLSGASPHDNRDGGK
jgi:hypothetical protein